MTTQRTVIETLSELKAIPLGNISPFNKLVELDMDSLDLAEAVMDLEDTLSVRIKDDDVLCVMTVQDLIDVCDAAVAAKEPQHGM